MSESKRFQNKKLNKENNEQIKKAAKGLKRFVGVAGAVAMATSVMKKYGKDILKVGKNIIYKG